MTLQIPSCTFLSTLNSEGLFEEVRKSFLRPSMCPATNMFTQTHSGTSSPDRPITKGHTPTKPQTHTASLHNTDTFWLSTGSAAVHWWSVCMCSVYTCFVSHYSGFDCWRKMCLRMWEFRGQTFLLFDPGTPKMSVYCFKTKCQFKVTLHACALWNSNLPPVCKSHFIR